MSCSPRDHPPARTRRQRLDALLPVPERQRAALGTLGGHGTGAGRAPETTKLSLLRGVLL
jgi:hypothetical protein